MATTRPTKFIKLHDPRTNKVYCLADHAYMSDEQAMVKLRQQMELDYFNTLSPEKKREVRMYKGLNFTCPHCKTDAVIKTRKQQMTSSGFFSSYSYLVDINICTNCFCEFTDEELHRVKQGITHGVITQYLHEKEEELSD